MFRVVIALERQQIVEAILCEDRAREWVRNRLRVEYPSAEIIDSEVKAHWSALVVRAPDFVSLAEIG